MIVVSDIETNRLVNPDKIWCAVFREVDNPEKVYVFERPEINPAPLVQFLSTVDVLIGHNYIGFDLPNLIRLVDNLNYSSDNVIDTLIVSRLLNYNIEGGHSIEAWANRLGGGLAKVGKDITDWETYDPLILERCINDTLVNLRLYNYLKPYITDPMWSSALRTEHSIGSICERLHRTGFPFKQAEAQTLHNTLHTELEILDNELKTAFPPKAYEVRRVVPRLTSKGTLNRSDFRWYTGDDFTCFSEGSEFSVIDWEEFNPGSPKQIVERLNAAGWKPTERTKGHNEFLKNLPRSRKGISSEDREKLERYSKYGWSISETNLRTLPKDAPRAAFNLVRRLLLGSRVSDLEEWLALSKQSEVNPDVHAIYGRFNHIGAWTHRMSHNNPNMANIPIPQDKDNPSDLDKFSDKINTKMRGLWYAPKGYRLIGTDAAGIQMRIFAHYVNDLRLIKALIEGKKEDGTDIHSLHWKALGAACKGRNPAKTFIYAWLLGAGVGKVAHILECSVDEARDAIDRFIEFYPGLRELKDSKIPSDASRGYFKGLDGRLVICESEHKMLGGYLQNGESVIMKRANIQWRKQLEEDDVPFWQLNFVHDEWQTLAPDDDIICNYIAEVQKQSIRVQGVQLNLNCPLDADSKFGYDWMETH